MPEPVLPPHTYQAKNPEERKKLAELTAARCQVKLREVLNQPGLSGITIVFFRSSTTRMVVLEILGPEGSTTDLVELSRPMQELELHSLGEVGEVDAPEVKVALGKDGAIRLLEQMSCRINSNDVNDLIGVRNNSSYPVIITHTDGRMVKIGAGEGALDIRSATIASIQLDCGGETEEITDPLEADTQTNTLWETLCREAIVQPWSPGTGEEGEWFMATYQDKSASGRSKHEALRNLSLLFQQS